MFFLAENFEQMREALENNNITPFKILDGHKYYVMKVTKEELNQRLVILARKYKFILKEEVNGEKTKESTCNRTT